MEFLVGFQGSPDITRLHRFGEAPIGIPPAAAALAAAALAATGVALSQTLVLSGLGAVITGMIALTIALRRRFARV